jgi:hypothetical protein
MDIDFALLAVAHLECEPPCHVRRAGNSGGYNFGIEISRPGRLYLHMHVGSSLQNRSHKAGRRPKQIKY